MASPRPAGTPKESIDKLNQALVQALAKPEVQAGLEKSGVEGKASSPEELKALIASELTRWTALIKEAGIQPE
jgi:tripartite-type tricarboxylate transporter receptor subunit TctC